MDEELKEVLTRLIKNTVLVTLPVALFVGFIKSPMAALAVFTGAFLSLGNVSLSGYILSKTLAQGKTVVGYVIFTLGKILVTALIGLFFSKFGLDGIIFFILGYTLIFVGLILYTKRTLFQSKEGSKF